MTDIGPSAGGRAAVGAHWLALLLVLPGTGCAVWGLADRTLHTELAEYPRVTDGYRAKQVYQQWAQTEWDRAVAQSPHLGESLEYRRGFLEGFVDYVCRGGDGEPPVIPPRRFWQITYRSPAGDAALAEWSQGFRHGAQVAHENGYRRRAVVPPTTTFAPSPAGAVPVEEEGAMSEELPLQFDIPADGPAADMPDGSAEPTTQATDRTSTLPQMIVEPPAKTQRPSGGPLAGGAHELALPGLPSRLDEAAAARPTPETPRLQLGSPRLLEGPAPERPEVQVAQRDPIERIVGSGADPKLSLSSPRPLADLALPDDQPPAPSLPDPNDPPAAETPLPDQLPPPPPWLQGPGQADAAAGGGDADAAAASTSASSTGAWRARDN